MQAAAENLVPVTLELGGKSPVVVGRSADMSVAAARIMNGKTLNAGQICLAPDYVLAPSDRLPDFVAAAKMSVGQMFPSIRESSDYTAIVTDRHYARLMDYLDDARAKGAEIVEVNYTIDADAPIPLKLVSAELKPAASEGNIYFDREKGTIVENVSSVHIKGTISFELNGTSVPAELDLKMSSSSITPVPVTPPAQSTASSPSRGATGATGMAVSPRPP